MKLVTRIKIETGICSIRIEESDIFAPDTKILRLTFPNKMI